MFDQTKLNEDFIFSKLDYFTAVIANVSVGQLLDWLQQTDLFSDFYASAAFRPFAGSVDSFVLTYGGITFSVNLRDFGATCPDMQMISGDAALSTVFPAIRFNVSGSGLDLLRSKGFDCDTVFRQELPFDNWHLTRCDIAFDLVNYNGHILDQMISYCQHYSTPSGRVCLYGTPSGSSWSAKTGSQKTLYLGSTQSDQLLRVYDKLLQQCPDGVWKEPFPYGDASNVRSWIRFELQLRNTKAMKILYSDSEDWWLSVWKYIYEKYSFVDPSTTKQNRRPAQFWVDLFDWNLIPSLGFRGVFSSAKKLVTPDFLEKCSEYWVRRVAQYIDCFGVSALLDRVVAYLNDLSVPASTVSGSMIQRRRLRSFLCDKNVYDPGMIGAIKVSDQHRLMLDLK